MARPNILLVMYDQMSARALRAYGNPTSRTPVIDRLADESAVFDSAYSNSPLCTPARYCMMTGRLPSATGGYDNAAYLPSTVPTFAHYLRIAGYRTVLAGKMHFVGPDQLHGFEERRTTDIYPADFGWTPDWTRFEERIDWWYHNMSSVTGAGTAEVTNQLLYDDEVGAAAIRALHDLARADDDRPFCLVASFTHPHDPYVARQRHWDLYEGDEIDMPRVPAPVHDHPHHRRLAHVSDMSASTITDDDVRRARRAYYANCSYVDEWTGRIMDTLRALGKADDTVTVVTADHGDMLGEPVSLVDVLPTLVDLAGAGSEVRATDGETLLPFCAGRRAGEPGRTVAGEYLAEGAVAPIVMVRRGRWKFVHCPADPDQLFDVESDPDEVRNLADDPSHATVLDGFRREVAGRWDLAALHQSVLESQQARLLVTRALRSGAFTSWEWAPPRNPGGEYMRNHLDLNDVERLARWPR